MKILLLALTFFMISTFAIAQPKIQFDTTLYDYGNVVESNSSLLATYWFTNTGTEPLVISRVQGSGGGLAPNEWPKDSILPGKRNAITLRYDGKRIGPINKTVVVTSNAKNNPEIVLRVKGVVLLKKTTIKVNTSEADIGAISFGEVDTLSFLVTNTGNEPLHFNFLDFHNSSLIDLFYRRFSLFSPLNDKNILLKTNYEEIIAQPNEMIHVQICLLNNYGNVGQLERYLYFKYNSHDTLKYKIKANYIGEPFNEKLYEQNSLSEYVAGKLVKRTVYNRDGLIRKIDNFQDGHLINSIMHDFPNNNDKTEYFYRNDLMIESIVTKGEH